MSDAAEPANEHVNKAPEQPAPSADEPHEAPPAAAPDDTKSEAAKPAETKPAEPAEPPHEAAPPAEAKTADVAPAEPPSEPKEEAPASTPESSTEAPKGEAKPEPDAAPAADEPGAEPAAQEAPPPEPEPLHVAPVITSVRPDRGPLSGGTTITIQGEAFVEGVTVLIGDLVATVVRDSDTTLTVVTPPHEQKGFVEVRVVNPGGPYAIYEEDFRYDGPPSIRGVAPPCVSVEGGTVLTVLGADFAEGCAVRIGGELVPCSWANAGRLEAVTKHRDPGEADVTVENPDGQRATREKAVSFASSPHIDAVTPATVSTVGGAEVRITGSSFVAGSAVIVGDKTISGANFVSATEIVIVAPPDLAPGTFDVSVVTPSGLSHRAPLALAFVKEPPHVDSVSPDAGPSAGGTELVVRGRGFDPEVTAFVCGVAARVAWKSGDELVVTTPEVSRDGVVDLRIVNVDGQLHVVERAFRYIAAIPPPRLLQVGTASGSQEGGLEVALLGEDFADGCTARFGGVAAAVRFLTHKELRATTPAYVGFGEVAVEVTNPDGARSVLDAAFRYDPKPGPEIAGLTPANGPTTGGTRVVIEGKNFARNVAVYVGREHPKDIAVKSPTEIVIVTAARAQAGVVDVEVVLPGAPKAVAKNGFRYDAVPAPVITSVSPNAGTPGGGTETTISGKNFTKQTVVLVGGVAPRAVKLVDASTLEFKTPPGDAGKMVDVVVKNPDGKEAVQKRAFLYDPRYRG